MIESPCVKICTLDVQRKLCLGCGRTIEEIGRWSGMTSADRRRVMDELPGRQAALKEAALKAKNSPSSAHAIAP